MELFHFTDRDGYNGIRAAVNWRFKASQPPPRDHPVGAYFTTLPPGTRRLAYRLRIPAAKTGFVFAFGDAGDLRPLAGGRGATIFYSPEDYEVTPDRQIDSGEADQVRLRMHDRGGSLP
jgi:hypothetical protein